MSHLHAITGDTDDEALRQLVRDSLKDKWSFLNDLEQTQLLYEAHEYRKQLMDQRPIIEPAIILLRPPLFRTKVFLCTFTPLIPWRHIPRNCSDTCRTAVIQSLVFHLNSPTL